MIYDDNHYKKNRLLSFIEYGTRKCDTTGPRMAQVPSVHHTKFAVSTPKNLQLPPNLKEETTTTRKASGYQSTRAPQQLPHCTLLTLMGLGPGYSHSCQYNPTPNHPPNRAQPWKTPFFNWNFNSFIRNHNQCRPMKRVIFHEPPASQNMPSSSCCQSHHSAGSACPLTVSFSFALAA